jgi:Protein of unknown function (DUF3465)
MRSAYSPRFVRSLPLSLLSVNDSIDASLFSRYPDDDVLAAAAQRRVTDVEVAGTVAAPPHIFFGRRTHAWHETFPIVTEHGLRIDVVDNIDLAPKIPVEAGDVVVVAGQFIPRKGGGLIHDTHHCPGRGWHRGGWIEWHGRRFEAPTRR